MFQDDTQHSPVWWVRAGTGLARSSRALQSQGRADTQVSALPLNGYLYPDMHRIEEGIFCEAKSPVKYSGHAGLHLLASLVTAAWLGQS